MQEGMYEMNIYDWEKEKDSRVDAGKRGMLARGYVDEYI